MSYAVPKKAELTVTVIPKTSNVQCPFCPDVQTEEQTTQKIFDQALKHCWEISRINGNDKMTMEEIDAEITETRKTRESRWKQ
jgi:hypothetical protein